MMQIPKIFDFNIIEKLFDDPPSFNIQDGFIFYLSFEEQTIFREYIIQLKNILIDLRDWTEFFDNEEEEASINTGDGIRNEADYMEIEDEESELDEVYMRDEFYTNYISLLENLEGGMLSGDLIYLFQGIARFTYKFAKEVHDKPLFKISREILKIFAKIPKEKDFLDPQVYDPIISQPFNDDVTHSLNEEYSIIMNLEIPTQDFSFYLDQQQRLLDIQYKAEIYHYIKDVTFQTAKDNSTPSVSIADLSRIFSLTSADVMKYLKKLVSEERIEMIGQDVTSI